MSPYFQHHSNVLTLDASRYSEEGHPRATRKCDYVKSLYDYITLSLTNLQSSSRTRMLWGTTMMPLVVPNRPLGFDVLATKVEGYVGHSNSAVFSTIPVPTNSQQTAAFSTSRAEGKTVLSRVEVPNNWLQSLAISSNLNESTFCSFMSRTISCEWNEYIQL